MIANNIIDILNKINDCIKNYVAVFLMYTFRIFKIKNNKIVFVSYFGDYYNDNPLKISEVLQNYKDIDIVWCLRDGVAHSDSIRTVLPGSFSYIYELATARVWVDNCRKNKWIRKREGQFYIQTWHGNLGNKRVEKAALETLEKDYIERAIRDAKYTDVMISGSTFFTNLCYKYFWYEGKVLECGTPRLDIFFENRESIKATVRKKLRINEKDCVVLYAPTFRADHRTDCYDIDFSALAKAIKRVYNQDACFLMRLHPNVANENFTNDYSDILIDVTQYQNLYELIMASDIVISDYSSLSFEAGLLKMPIMLYTPDLEEYKIERGFYWDIEELPFPYAMDNETLCNLITYVNTDKYKEKLNRFYQKLGIKEYGNASETIAKEIIKIIDSYQL